MSAARSVRARRIDAGEPLRALEASTEPHYAAAWEVASAYGDGRSAEQWARAVFEGAPSPLRELVAVGWKYGLGLRLGPRESRGHVLGWEIVAVSPELIVVRVESVLLGTAHLLVQVQRTRVLLGSFVRYEKRGARQIWAVVQPVHHRVVPCLLGRAASRASDQQSSNVAGRPS